MKKRDRMVIPGSQYSNFNFTFNIFFVICHMKKARLQINIVVVVGTYKNAQNFTSISQKNL